MKVINKLWFVTLIPSLIGAGCVALCVLCFSEYGWSLFFALPVLVSFLSAFCASFQQTISFKRAYGLAVLSLMMLGAFILFFALDGLICLLMALPLTLLLALAGTVIGWKWGGACRGNRPVLIPLLLLALFPFLAAFESNEKSAVPLRVVTTSVVINAPAKKVWDIVVAFPRIEKPPEGVFRCGIACPMEARIDGSGVGATRYCIFTTGSFVEPITTWEPPSLLAFDVVSNPPPMVEFTPYGSIQVPHLHGYMISKHGQFKLIEKDGTVILEGTTWYTHSLEPQWYWGPISDQIIHRIHNRVLEHIKEVAEVR